MIIPVITSAHTPKPTPASPSTVPPAPTPAPTAAADNAGSSQSSLSASSSSGTAIATNSGEPSTPKVAPDSDQPIVSPASNVETSSSGPDIGGLFSVLESAAHTFAPTSNTPAATTSAATTSLTIGSQAYVVGSDNGIVSVGTTSLRVGGSPVTIDGHQWSAGSSFLVVDSSTVPIGNLAATTGAATPTPLAVTIDGKEYTFTAHGSSAVVVDSSTLEVGGSAATIDGQVVSAYSGGVRVGTSSISLPSSAPATTASATTTGKEEGILASNAEGVAFTIGSQGYTASVVSGSNEEVVVFGSQTLTVGGSAITTAGKTLSAESNGIEIDGSLTKYQTNTIAATTTVSPANTQAVEPSTVTSPSPAAVSSGDSGTTTTTTGSSTSSGAAGYCSSWSLLLGMSAWAILKGIL